jgi:hydroxypyruvate isomerase
MQRRQFLAGAAAGLGAAGACRAQTAVAGLAAAPAAPAATPQQGKPFKLKYAPHFGMFSNHAKGAVDELRFMHDQGFRAIEDNGMSRRGVEQQDLIAKEMARLGMEMGVFVAHADFRRVTFAAAGQAMAAQLVAEMKQAVECASRVNAKWCTVVPGKLDPRLEWGYQTANVIDNLKRCAEVCEPTGLVMVLEALNPWRDHPGLFLTKIPQAYQICKAVDSPSVRILDDLYHQQITEGNLIPNMDRAWSQIAYFQIGDNPGRKEPTTGEINYKNIFKHIHGRGYTGIMGMEHGKSRGGKEGELALVRAYQDCDGF